MIEDFSNFKIDRNSQLAKRIKSFLWRGGAVALVAFINFATVNITDLGLPTWGATMLGLVLGEVTKYLNK